jgi:hypothetical protein
LTLVDQGRKGEISFKKPPSQVKEELILMVDAALAQQEGRLL